jgi:hypothetical protein
VAPVPTVTAPAILSGSDGFLRLRLRQFRSDGSSSDRSDSDGYDSGSGGSGGSLRLWRFSPAPMAPFLTAPVALAPNDMALAAPAVPASGAPVL